MQHTAIHCNALQSAATRSNTLQHTPPYHVHYYLPSSPPFLPPVPAMNDTLSLSLSPTPFPPPSRHSLSLSFSLCLSFSHSLSLILSLTVSLSLVRTRHRNRAPHLPSCQFSLALYFPHTLTHKHTHSLARSLARSLLFSQDRGFRSTGMPMRGRPRSCGRVFSHRTCNKYTRSISCSCAAAATTTPTPATPAPAATRPTLHYLPAIWQLHTSTPTQAAATTIRPCICCGTFCNASRRLRQFAWRAGGGREGTQRRVGVIAEPAGTGNCFSCRCNCCST